MYSISKKEFIDKMNLFFPQDSINSYVGPIRGCKCGCMGDFKDFTKEEIAKLIKTKTFVVLEIPKLDNVIWNYITNLEDKETNFIVFNEQYNSVSFYIFKRILKQLNCSTFEPKQKIMIQINKDF